MTEACQNGKRAGWIFILGAAACLFLLPVQASAQRLFWFERWEGFIETGFEWSDEETSTAGGADLNLRRSRFDERLNLRTIAFIIDPRFVTINSAFTLGLFQDRFSVEEQTTPGDGELLGYDLGASILPAKPYSFRLFANRSQSTVTREFAGRTEVLAENRGATLDLRRIFFPSTLSYRQELLVEESRFGAFLGRREEFKNILSYEGNRTWQASSLGLRYEHADVEDRVDLQRSYRTTMASLSHRITFGEDHPKTLNTSLRSFARAGRFGLSSITANENFRLQHSDTLSTGYQANFSRFTVDGAETTTRMGLFSLQHQLYESLKTNLNLSRTLATFQTGEEETFRGRLDLRYQKNINAGGKLLASLGRTYELRDAQMEEEEVLVFQESHKAELGVPFLLDRPRVVPGSLVVIDQARSTIFQEGLDYVVRIIGELVEIDIVPSGRIADQQQLLVDYQVLTSPSREFSTTATRFSIGADYAWIHPYYAYDRVDQDLIAGMDDATLDELSTHTAGVRFRWSRGRANVSLRNEYRKQDSQRLAFESFQFGQFLTYVPDPAVRITLSLKETFSEFTVPERQTRSFIGRLSTRWRLRPSLLLEGLASARLWKDTIVADETFYDAGFRVRWSFAKVEIVSAFNYSVRRRGLTAARDFGTSVRIVRRF